GFSGTNAHLVIEEYVPEMRSISTRMRGSCAPTVHHPAIIVLSAKNEARLREQAQRVLSAIAKQSFSDNDLLDMAYTLQVGREAMEERLALLVTSMEELEEKLKHFADGGDDLQQVYRGQVKDHKEALTIFTADEDMTKAMATTIDVWIRKGKYAKLLDLWVKGLIVDWNTLYGDLKPRRISLPTYPFARERYWVPETRTAPLGLEVSSVSIASAASSTDTISPDIPDKPGELSLPSLPEQRIMPQHSGAQATQAIRLDAVETHAQAEISTQKLQQELTTSLSEILYMKRDDIDPEKQFIDLGMDSIIGVEWMHSLNQQYGISMIATQLYDHPNIREFAEFLSKKIDKGSKKSQSDFRVKSLPGLTTSPEIVKNEAENRLTVVKEQEERIAIIGMSGRYSQAGDIHQYWENLVQGNNSIREIPPSRWNVSQYYDPRPNQQGKIYCKWLGALDEIDCFDPLFFNISPAEANLMDPQQRLFLQEAYTAFEDAGYSRQSLSNHKCGVYLGIMNNEYALLLSQRQGGIGHITGNSFAIAAARIAYYLNLKGPAIPVDTACSSSLVATHLACQALLHREINMALVGGVTLYLTPESYLGMCAAGMLAPDGHCKTFDNKADGFVPGEGVGALVLKRLSDAVHDRDAIYGVIIGSGINQDGKTNGITAPSISSQMDLEREIYEKYTIHPETISYVEMHGTGTKLGDPIELEALSTVFQERSDKKAWCAIGSVKSNIGHTSAAAGVASVQKVLLCLKHKQFVPTLHFSAPNEHFAFQHSPFYVNTELKPWETASEVPRRAAVSSFGFSGTNAHIVIEEYVPEMRNSSTPTPHHPAIIVLSAKNEVRLREQAQRVLSAIAKQSFSANDLLDMAYTLQVGREAMEERLALLVTSMEELEEKLKRFADGGDDLQQVYRGQVKRHKETLALFTADEDMANAIDAWIRKGKYTKLLELWVKGLMIDWNLLYGTDKPRRISLPTYPFARERYWIPEVERRKSNAESRTSPESENEDADKLLTFEETWQKQDISGPSVITMNSVICFLSNPENQHACVETLRNLDRRTHVIFISQGTTYQKQSQQQYTILRTNHNMYVDAFKSIREDYGAVDAVLYLWAMEDHTCIQDCFCIVSILQAVAAAKLQPRRCLLAAQWKTPLERCYLDSWVGFERSSNIVLPNIDIAVISQEAPQDSRKAPMNAWMKTLWTELHTPKSESVSYHKGTRHVCRIRPTTIQTGNSVIRAQGTYLITGGCGGLGYLFATYIAQKHPVNLILTGRSPINVAKQSQINALEASGSQVLYVQADICDQIGMKEGLRQVKERFGGVQGVIHAAGIQENQSVLHKERRSFQAILAPKITGTLVLDETLQEEALDFICYFSSSSAILGDFGSCDYAVGNRFQTAYAHYRNQQHNQGRAVVINWPLWRAGGMGFDDHENAELYLKSSGQRVLESEEGVTLFERLLSHPRAQHLVLAGESSRIHRFLGLTPTPSSPPSPSVPAISRSFATDKGQRGNMHAWSVRQCLEWDIQEEIGQLLNIPRDQLEPDENLAEFGFDSISLAKLATLLSEHYDLEITPAVFFGHATIARVSQYFLTDHQDVMRAFYQEDAREPNIMPGVPLETALPPERQPRQESGFGTRPTAPSVPEPIAVIGMSGRFPQANSVAEFWQNLRDGKNCITEIPGDRWDWREYDEDPYRKTGKHIPKWGGFINGVDRFDPLFFEISPKEAALIDPRQRLFLEEAWHACEDAGYMGKRIRGTRCGVYVGVEEGDYGLFSTARGQINSNQNATLAARIAYALDLKGPNFALTAACSSGLVALHQACQALRQGDCDMALVGGVNLLLSPRAYIALNHVDMLSPDGTCSVFDRRANGLVPGEAVAVVVLKPFAQAISDRDHIYGCITASGVNYDGHTNGITAPNPFSQAELVTTLYDKYHIQPENIQYVLSHSVGSKLGDPIEVQALTDAFTQYTQKKHYCALGSIKPLIGHTFAASGVVSLISMLLAMKHHTIPMTRNYESSNEYIHFNETPFIVNTENQHWAARNEQPRVGVIGTTGISGTNAHAVITEYLLPQTEAIPTGPAATPHIMVFSAMNAGRLQAIVRHMLNFLQHESSAALHISDIAYTLQTGREALKERLAILVSSKKEFVQMLQDYMSLPEQRLPDAPVRNFQEKRMFVGNSKASSADSLNGTCDDTQEGILDQIAMKESNLERLASCWVQGRAISWEQLHQGTSVKKVSLPTYPFSKRRCWISPRKHDVALLQQTELPQEKDHATPVQQEYANKAVELYTFAARGTGQELQQQYLTFCPFEEKVPGFSMSRVCLNPKKFPTEEEFIESRQIEMRQVLFCKEDFMHIQTLLDIGCGYGTDVIRIAALYPHIRIHGCTITKDQAEIGNERLTQLNAGSQAAIFHQDSSKEAFSGRYDLIIGIEVICHIRDKEGVLQNMSAALNDDGKVLLMDFMANLRGPIVNPDIEISISTTQDWIELLSKYQFVIDEMIDVSPQIANFLYDPECEQHTEGYPKVVRDALQNFAHTAISLEKGWVSYCLWKLKKDTKHSPRELLDHNAHKIATKTPYLEAVKEMLAQSHVPYPQNKKHTRRC
ncbi:MAG: SDR family NAD(P)-dependent oxidoreductase, partial [bacterium]|nr:SDR family NAD(P)-dependent oxidoreductase [bacterium]